MKYEKERIDKIENDLYSYLEEHVSHEAANAYRVTAVASLLGRVMTDFVAHMSPELKAYAIITSVENVTKLIIEMVLRNEEQEQGSTG